jgi:hypothetical protein
MVAFGSFSETRRKNVSVRCVPVVAPDKEFVGVRFGEAKNAKNGVSRVYLIKFQSVLPIQEHHPPQCPGI